MEQIILFAFLAIFPFGQLIKIGIVNPIDVVVGVGAIYAIVRGYKRPAVFTYFQNFLLIAAFSWVVGAFLFQKQEVLIGLLYLFRLVAYFYFFVLVYNFKNKKLLINSLLAVSIFSAVFGWIQYFVYPDLRPLLWIGWDEHLYRMAGTFFDPGFLGLILALGLVIALWKKKSFLVLFLIASIAFTYSRASYLAALIPLIAKRSWLFLIIFIAIILVLPRPGGEGVRLERTESIKLRLENYQQSVNVFKGNPLFGVGFNNICLTKDEDFLNHACSGSDSSFLFLLATTGVIGFISFTNLVFRVGQVADNFLVPVSVLAVFVHSFFANSLFYPFTMGYLLILIAVSLRREVKGKGSL